MSNYKKRVDYTLAFTRKIPDYIKINYPNFISFIEIYYKFLIDNDYIKLEDIRDVDKTHELFLNQYKQEFSMFFPIHEVNDNKSEILKHLREFYLSRGTEKSFNVLFSVLYNTLPSFRYPYDNVFVPSASKWQQEQFIEVQRYSGDFPDIMSSIQVTESSGTIVSIPVTRHELLTNESLIYSAENLSDTSVWTYGGNALVLSNETTDPFGGNTADLIYNSSTNPSAPIISQTFKTSNNTQFYVSAYVKKETTNYWYIQIINPVNNNYVNMFMRTSLIGTGLMGYGRSGSQFAIDQSKFLMTDEGNDWYRVSFPVTTPRNINARITIGVMSRYPWTSTVTDPNEGSYVWGVCVESGNIRNDYKKGRSRIYFKSEPNVSFSYDNLVKVYNKDNIKTTVGRIKYCPSKVNIINPGKGWVTGQTIKIPGTEKDTIIQVTKVNTKTGAIQALKIIDIGYNHLSDNITVYPDQTKDPSTVTILSVATKTHVTGFTHGVWLDNKSHVSDRLCNLQDNNFYQKMSYQLSSEINPNKYINIVNEINHPAGKKSFYNYEITQDYKTNFGITIDEISSFSKNLNPELSTNVTFHENEITSSGNRYELGDYFDSREDLNIQNHYCEISSLITINISEDS